MLTSCHRSEVKLLVVTAPLCVVDKYANVCVSEASAAIGSTLQTTEILGRECAVFCLCGFSLILSIAGIDSSRDVLLRRRRRWRGVIGPEAGEGSVGVSWLFHPRNQRPLKCGLPNCAAVAPPWLGFCKGVDQIYHFYWVLSLQIEQLVILGW